MHEKREHCFSRGVSSQVSLCVRSSVLCNLTCQRWLLNRLGHFPSVMPNTSHSVLHRKLSLWQVGGLKTAWNLTILPWFLWTHTSSFPTPLFFSPVSVLFVPDPPPTPRCIGPIFNLEIPHTRRDCVVLPALYVSQIDTYTLAQENTQLPATWPTCCPPPHINKLLVILTTTEHLGPAGSRCPGYPEQLAIYFLILIFYFCVCFQLMLQTVGCHRKVPSSFLSKEPQCPHIGRRLRVRFPIPVLCQEGAGTQAIQRLSIK